MSNKVNCEVRRSPDNDLITFLIKKNWVRPMHFINATKAIRVRVSRYLKNHPVIFSFGLSASLVIILHFTYIILVDLYPPKMIGNYIIYIKWAEGYGVTHRNMIIFIYSSFIFLFSSLAYIRTKVLETLANLKSSIVKPDSFLQHYSKLIFSNRSYLLAVVFAFFFTFGFEVFLLWVSGASLTIIYINIPIFTYFVSVYFLIAFLVGKGVWTVLATVYSINQAAKQDFRMDIRDPWCWVDDANIGGFKQLSKLSTNIFIPVPIGVVLFSPAVIFYYFELYAVYFFSAIIIATALFFISQRIIHKAILRNKGKFNDLAKSKLYAGEINLSEYYSLVTLIKSINDRPVDLTKLWGIVLSSIVLPVFYWYTLLILREIWGIVPP